MGGARTKKSEVLEETLRQLGMSGRRSEVVLVGDRMYDVEGAKQAGVGSIGVTYGYGSRTELEECWPDCIVDSTEELRNVLIGQARDEQGEYVKKYGREAYEDLTIQDVAMFETQFPSALVAGTGGVRRVEVEAVYAVVDSFAYSVVYEDYDTDTYDSSSVNVKAIVRIPSPELDVSRAQAYVKIHLNPRDVLESVALAAGVPDPPEDIAAFTPGLHYTKEWRMTCNQFILFYRIHPSSKFDNW